MRHLVAGIVAAVLLTACSSSSHHASKTASKPARSALPTACALLNKHEMLPVFGTTRISTRPTSGPASGTEQCGYSRVLGSHVELVSVWARTDYARDPSYLFPLRGKSIPGIGNYAVVSPTAPLDAKITVKLGVNAIEIDVVSTERQVDPEVVIKLAQDAVSRSRRRS